MSPCYCTTSDLFGAEGDGSAQTGPGALRVVHGAAEEEILTSITSSAFSVQKNKTKRAQIQKGFREYLYLLSQLANIHSDLNRARSSCQPPTESLHIQWIPEPTCFSYR